MSNIENCFTSYPDYMITEHTLHQMVPTCRPDYSGYETRRVLNETRELNRQLREQLNEMSLRLSELEKYREGQ